MATSIQLKPASAADCQVMLPDLCDVFADAYRSLQGEDLAVKTAAFAARLKLFIKQAPVFSGVFATASEQLIGFVFGFALAPDTKWWAGLNPSKSAKFTSETGTRTVMLAEIEVRFEWQGRGIGRRLHDQFVEGRRESRATLACNPNAVGTHHIYRHWGWDLVGVTPGGEGSYYQSYAKFIKPLVERNP